MSSENNINMNPDKKLYYRGFSGPLMCTSMTAECAVKHLEKMVDNPGTEIEATPSEFVDSATAISYIREGSISGSDK